MKTRKNSPSCLYNKQLDDLPQGTIATVAGLVMVRQRPKTAKGVIFLTLEDETAIANIIVWRRTYEIFRRAVVCGRLLRVTGKIERDGVVVHLIASRIEDISHLLDLLLPGMDTSQNTKSVQNQVPANMGKVQATVIDQPQR